MAQITLGQALEMARQHFQNRRLRESETVCRVILDQYPEHPEALYVMGTLGVECGKFEEAIGFLRRAAAARPGHAEYLFKLGQALRWANRADEAVNAFRRAIELNPANPQAHAILADLLARKGQDLEALAAYRQATQLKPDFAEAFANSGLLLDRQGRGDEAIAEFQKALAVRPDLPEVHVNLGNTLQNLGRAEEAITCFRQAITLRPNYALAHNNLGGSLGYLGRFAEAVAAYDRALQLQPDFPVSHNNRSLMLNNLDRFDEALIGFRRAIVLDPNFAEAHWNHALALLQAGDCSRGWVEYEWRWKWAQFPDARRHVNVPTWDGSNPAGKTLLLYSEQGIGDTIQIIRYASLLADRGARVLVECQPAVARLVRSVQGVSEVFHRKAPLPNFDLQLPMMSLPGRFGTTMQTIPRAVPYLQPPEDAILEWGRRLEVEEGGQRALRVGVVWSGSTLFRMNHWRSLALSQYAPLARRAGSDRVRFYSLQKGPAALEASGQSHLPLVDYTAEFHDFADTAALMANLDLIITVDTGVAHLSGALGKKTWVLLGHSADWRWLRDRSDSPWYPTMRLFRQQKIGEWEPLVEEVARELEQFVKYQQA